MACSTQPPPLSQSWKLFVLNLGRNPKAWSALPPGPESAAPTHPQPSSGALRPVWAWTKPWAQNMHRINETRSQDLSQKVKGSVLGDGGYDLQVTVTWRPKWLN